MKLILLVFCASLLFGGRAGASAVGKDISREQHWVVTEERFELFIERFRLAGKPQAQPPVILSHGLFVNDRFMNLAEDYSLARYLALQGLDVWNLALRGNGRSLNPLRGGPKTWSLDEIIDRDIKAVISYVVKETKTERPSWVAYGMGGLLLYGYLGKVRDSGLSAVVTIGTPVTFDQPEQEFMKKFLVLNDYPRLKDLALYLTWPSIGSFVLNLVPSVQQGFYNPANIDDEVKGRLLENGLARINPGILEHLLLIIKEGEFVSMKNDFKYRNMLRRINLPTLLVGGDKDGLAPPEALRLVHGSLGSKDRTMKIFGGASNDAERYGHFDLILGRNAPAEVFPFVAEWLKQKSRRR